MIKCCIFDLDGTLLDTITSITYYVNITLQKHGISPITTDEAKIYVGDGAKRLIDRVLSAKGCYTEELSALFLAEYRAAYDSAPLYLTAPYDGIISAIDALRARGILLAVVSNKQHEAVVPIVKHFFGDAFSTVCGAKQGSPLKPNPEVLLSVIEELGVNSCEVAYFGDTDVDMKTGRAAAVALNVGVLWGFRSAAELSANGADILLLQPQQIEEAVKV